MTTETTALWARWAAGDDDAGRALCDRPFIPLGEHGGDCGPGLRWLWEHGKRPVAPMPRSPLQGVWWMWLIEDVDSRRRGPQRGRTRSIKP